MAIAFASSASGQLNSSNTSLAVTTPATVADGSLILALVETNAAVTHTQPAGWTAIPSFAQLTSGTNSLSGWYRIASGDSSHSYTWSFSSATKCNIIYLVYTGQNATTPIDTAGIGTSSSPNAGTPSVTDTAGDWNVAVFTDRDSSAGSTWTTPTGMTSRVGLLNTGTSQGSLATFDTNGTVSAGTVSYASVSSTTQSNTVTGLIAILAPVATATFVPAETTQLGGFF